MNRRTIEGLLWVGAAMLACVVLLVRIRAVAVLCTDAYRDDAYYYFDFVRNLCSGRGPIVGDGPVTNGVQFLWVALLALLWWFGGDGLVEGGARWLGLTCLLAAAVALVAVLRREGVSLRLALFGGFLLLGDPFLCTEAQNGQESGLAVLMVVLLLRFRAARTLCFSMVCIAAILTRPELLLLAALLACLRREGNAMRAVGPTAALLAYGVVNFLLAGHVTPDAGWPLAFVAHAKFGARDPDLGAWLQQLWWWGRPCLLGGPYATASLLGCGALAALAAPRALRPSLALLCFAATLYAVGRGHLDFAVPLAALSILGFAPTRDAATVELARALLLAALGIVVLHDLVRWAPRDYYWVPLTALGTWGLARTAAALPTRALPLLLAAIGILHSTRLAEAPRSFPWQANLRLAAEGLREFVPVGGRIGSFNAGILGYFSACRVVNLDGVVNAAAFDALAAYDLAGYLQREHIDWLCDDPRALQEGSEMQAQRAFFGSVFDPQRQLIEVARMADLRVPSNRLDGWSAHVGLWRREGSAAIGTAVIGDFRDFGDLGAPLGGGRMVAWYNRLDTVLRLSLDGDTSVALPRVAVGVTQLLWLPAPLPGRTARLSHAERQPDGRMGTRLLLEYR